MPQTTKDALVKKITNFSNEGFGRGSLLDACLFWEKNSKTLCKCIEDKKFTKADLEIISEKFLDVQYQFKYLDRFKLPEGNQIDIDSDFREMCKAYITLLVQFNEKFDKYLEFFDESSSYHKKMTALNIIRHFKGSEEDFKKEFKHIGNLLNDAIQLDPSCYESCCSLAVEYLDMVLPKSSFSEMKNSVERINFIYNYGYLNFIDTLRNSEKFIKWFKYGSVKADEREYSSDGVKLIVNELISTNNISEKDKEIIYKKIEPLFDKYIEFEKKYEDNNKSWIARYGEFLNKYKGWDGESEINVDYETLRNDYKEAIKHEFGDLNERDLHICSYSETKDIDFFIQEKICTYSFESDKIIIGLLDKISDEEKKRINESLKKYEDYEFKIYDLPEDICLLGRAKRLYNVTITSYFALSVPALDIVWEVNKLISEILPSKNEESEIIKINKKDSLNENWEPDDDKEKINQMKQNVSVIDSRLDEYKKSIDRYFAELVELKKENNKLKGILQEKGLLEKDQQEEDIIEKRQFYRIIVVGGSDDANKGYKNLWKNKAFLENLKNYHHLSESQFELKGDYSKQKDKKFADGIENGLISGSTDFVIILQSDHETALFNLMKDPEYSSRITVFGELDEDGNVSKINQHFSYTKFNDYLGRALEKYERRSKNDLIGLGINS